MGSPGTMSLRRRKKSKQDHATDWLATFLKAGAVGVAARGAGKGAKKGAKTGAKKAAAKGGKSLGRRILPFAAIGTAAVVAAKKLRSSDDSAQSWQPPANTSPTPVAPPEPSIRP